VRVAPSRRRLLREHAGDAEEPAAGVPVRARVGFPRLERALEIAPELLRGEVLLRPVAPLQESVAPPGPREGRPLCACDFI